MYVDNQPRIFSHQRTGSSGMIEVNVSQQNSVELRRG